MGWHRAAGALTLVLVLAGGCARDGGDGGDAAAGAAASSSAATAADAPLTAEQLELGVGPVREVELGPIDRAMAERGEAIFETKCFACHRLGERYVAPQLGNVLERRRPEYVLNMVLNPAEMLERHPVAKGLLAEYMTMMPDQDITEEEARAVLEYIRAEAAEHGGGAPDGSETAAKRNR